MAILKGGSQDDLTIKYLLEQNKGKDYSEDIDDLQTSVESIEQTVNDAISELDDDIDVINDIIGNTALPTTAQTLTGAVDELDGRISTLEQVVPITIKELWTNSDTTAQFTPQTIQIDLSGYSLVAVLAFFANGDMYGTPMTILPTTATGGYLSAATSVNNTVGHRIFDFVPTGIEFFNGYFNGAVDNRYCIPYKVYGIKGIT